MPHRETLFDTSSAVANLLVEAYRRMSPQQKMRCVLDCNAAAEAMALNRLRARHPGASREELQRRLAALRLGEPLMKQVFGLQWMQVPSDEVEDQVSDLEWPDVIGILQVQGARLDRSYLTRWATELGLEELLHDAIDAAQLE